MTMNFREESIFMLINIYNLLIMILTSSFDSVTPCMSNIVKFVHNAFRAHIVRSSHYRTMVVDVVKLCGRIP